MDFVLNERLAAGGFEVTRKFGCRILLKNEVNFPWFILVPEVLDGIEDLHQLDEETFAAVMTGVRKVSEFVEGHFKPEKQNVGCIGNMVRQMHIHVVGRFTDDPAWPGVVWACDAKRKYGVGEAEELVAAARDFLEA
ncbi:MAG: HIT family protein [Akkermansiaceae bacterium]|nr:HIT family protein [Akkermansiaceae bacterium]